ncbi:MAG TPA: competence protein CoiA family protein [Ohtaekwangia sp.]
MTTCECCGAELIPKCGNIRIHHWAHKGRSDCDHWWEPETEWHRKWKNQFPDEWQEIVKIDMDTGERHRADIYNPHMELVIEFQNSPIDTREKASREKFYKKMLWVEILCGKNVLDKHDLAANPFLIQKSIRTVDFSYDYSLCPNTVNSFAEDESTLYNVPPNFSANDATAGKLTLKSIQFGGKEGNQSFLPAIKFKYDIDDEPEPSSVATVDISRREFNTNGIANYNKYSKGDIVRVSSQEDEWDDSYGLVQNIFGNSLKIKIIHGDVPAVSDEIELTITKNPAYSSTLRDIWGDFKGDYRAGYGHNLDRFPTRTSARNADVWSLRSITTATGATIKIDYEADTYSKSIFSENNVLPLTQSTPIDVTPLPSSFGALAYVQTTLDPDYNMDFTTMYQVGQTVPMAVELRVDPPSGPPIDQIYNDNNGVVQLVTPTKVVIRIHTPQGTTIVGTPKGYLRLGSRDMTYGGGLRVKSISLSDALSQKTTRTTYTYDFNDVSSGTTSYEPLNIIGSDESALMKGFLYTPFAKLITLSREIPPPGVYYGKVQVNEEVSFGADAFESEGYSQFEFESFDASQIQHLQVFGQVADAATGANSYEGFSFSTVRTNIAKIEDNSAKMGALKSTAYFDRDGNKIKETTYLYDNGTTLPEGMEQGIIHETFNHARIVKNALPGDPTATLQGLITQRKKTPYVQVGKTDKNFKTGITTTSKNLAFDFYSGQPIKTLTSDGYGNYYLTETTPAYHVYTNMGLKVFTNGYLIPSKHMLTQEAASYVYKVNNETATQKIGLLAASVQTWSNDLPVLRPGMTLAQGTADETVYRKHAAYTFIGSDQVTLRPDGLYPVSEVQPFTVWSGNVSLSNGWLRTNMITLYDANSHALEAMDMNENFAATRTSFDLSRTIATIANAEYKEFGYSSAEERPLNGVFGTDVQHNSNSYTAVAHTGSKALITQPHARGFTFSLAPNLRTYRVSVWASSTDATIAFKRDNGAEESADSKIKGRAGAWYLLEADIPISQSVQSLEIWCRAGGAITYFDDFRVRPVDAAMTSYVYNTWGELSHILDNNNLYTEYRYDGMGRLTQTYAETLHNNFGSEGIAKVSEVVYNNGRLAPYQFTITSASTGSPGAVSPVGVQNVELGGEIVYNITSCANLTGLYLSGPESYADQTGWQTLADGTMIRYEDRKITFKNVRGSHSFQAVFSQPALGEIRCHSLPDPDPTCFDGSYDYAYYDACGTLGSYIHVPNWSSIPSNLRAGRTVINCCSTSSCSPCSIQN